VKTGFQVISKSLVVKKAFDGRGIRFSGNLEEFIQAFG
jgi:hypothetical protein